MATTPDPGAELKDLFATSVKQGQALVLDGLASWADLVEKTFPLPNIDTLPLASSMPNPRTTLDSGFGFVAEMLQLQKEFSVKLLDVLTPSGK